VSTQPSPLGEKMLTVHGPSSREMKAAKILCRKCRVGWVAHDERCSQCGYNEEREERMGRLVRNSLILLVSVLAVIWLIHRN
jgi:ribosomal protein L37E